MDVVHTQHDSGDTGKYFYFDDENFSKVVGYEDWNKAKFEIAQEGSKSWKGEVIVWKVTSGSHGRKSGGEADGDWQASDKISLQSCAKGLYKPGILYICANYIIPCYICFTIFVFCDIILLVLRNM